MWNLAYLRALFSSIPIFVLADVDCFVSLFSNNLSTLMLVVSIIEKHLGPDITYSRIVPATGIGMLWGSLYYSIQGYLYAHKTGRRDVTVQPYGINTPGTLTFTFSIVLGVYFSNLGGLENAKTEEEKNAVIENARELAWLVAVAANLLTGLLLLVSTAVAKQLQEFTPPLALLSSISGVAVAYLTLNSIVGSMVNPMVCVVSLFIVMMGYFGEIRWGPIPTAVFALLVGTILAWINGVNKWSEVEKNSKEIGFHGLVFPISDVINNFDKIDGFLGIIIPVAIAICLGTITCVELCHQGGDMYSVRWSMVGDGIGTTITALFGSYLGMTVYPNHPGYQMIGGRVGYNLANGICFFIFCMTGLAAPFLKLISVDALSPVIVFVGLVICSETLSIAKPRQYPVFIMGIAPTLAEWGMSTIADPLGSVVTTFPGFANNQKTAQAAASAMTASTQGLRNTGHGQMLTGLIWACMMLYIIDRNFIKASIWTFSAAIFSLFGFIHGTKVGWTWEDGDVGWHLCVGYSVIGVMMLIAHYFQGTDYVPPMIVDAPEDKDAAVRRSLMSSLGRVDPIFSQSKRKDQDKLESAKSDRELGSPDARFAGV